MRKTIVTLTPEEIEELRGFKGLAKRSRRECDRANILLLLHKGKKDAEIEEFLEVERATIWRTKKRFLKEGLISALGEKPRSGQPKKYGPVQEAEVVALACSDAPDGRARWTLELMKETLKKKEGLGTINRETIRLMLKKTNVSLG